MERLVTKRYLEQLSSNVNSGLYPRKVFERELRNYMKNEPEQTENEKKLRVWVSDTFKPSHIEEWFSRGDGWGYRSHYATHQPTGIMLNYETLRTKTEHYPHKDAAILVSFVKPPGIGLAYRLRDHDGRFKELWDEMQDLMFKKAEEETAENILQQIERSKEPVPF